MRLYTCFCLSPSAVCISGQYYAPSAGSGWSCLGRAWSPFLESYMDSISEQTTPRKTTSRAMADGFDIWNRKLHYYAGLYLLLFLWLFAFTGLLLNHSWQFAEFWPQRKQSTVERVVQ